MPQDTLKINDDIYEEIFTLTNGASALCFQCGVCTAICPWGLVKDETFSVRSLIRNAQLGLHRDNHNLWLCTTCGQCEVYCPRGVNVVDVIRALRFLAWRRNASPEGFPSLLWSVFWNNNPWEQPPSHRTNWGKHLDIPLFNDQNHEILYYVGCTASYDTRAQKIALNLIKIFQAVGISFGILGEQEPCSGEEVLSIGHTPYFRELCENAVNTFRSWKVSTLVTSDPHSYDAFKNHYNSTHKNLPDLLIPFHYTEFLWKIIKDGRLTFNSHNPLSQHKITYHDPCYLSRHNDVIEAPRNVLRAIPGVNLVEMENTGANTLCCGGGGGRMWLDTAPGERFSDLRVTEAQDTGAEILATACPYCISCLDDSLKDKGINDLIVMDIAEIVALALD
jgi:Fe-S oxidoreductase